MRAGAQAIAVGMIPAGKEVFAVPKVDLPITNFRGRDKCLEQTAKADTLIVDTEARTLSFVWQVEVRIKRHMTEFSGAWAGAPTYAIRAGTCRRRGCIRPVPPGVPKDEDA